MLFPRIELLHLLPCNSLTFLGVRSGYAVGETLLLNAEGEASALIIAEHLAKLWVLFRERKQPVLRLVL